MPHSIPTTLALFLLAIAAVRVWARRSMELLAPEERARALEASARGNIWPFVSLAAAVTAIHWTSTEWIPRYYRTGLFAFYMALPFFFSLGAAVGLWIRLSRGGLPPGYLRSVRARAVVFHLALLLSVSAIVYDVYLNLDRRDSQHESSNR